MAPVVPRCARQVLWSKASLSLVVLVIQNSLLVVMTRFSRKDVPPDENYHTSTLILNQEVVKMLMCLVIFYFDELSRHGDSASSVPSPGPQPPVKEVTVVVVDGAEEATADPQKRIGTQRSTDGKGRGTSALNYSTQDKGVNAEADTEVDEAEDDDASPLTSTKDDGCGDKRALLREAGSGSGKAGVHSATACSGPSRRLPEDPHRPTAPRTYLSPREYLRRLFVSIFKPDTILLLLPQILFTMQNFLIFVGLSNLDAVSFQVWSQTKLLSAALFSVWLLHRHLSAGQWASLALLTLGVLITQLTRGGTTSPAGALSGVRGSVAGSTTTTAAPLDTAIDRNSQLLGIAACVLSGFSSSYAGVYFEKVVKTTSPTLAIRNIQLSLFGIPLAFLSMVVLDVVPNWREQQQCGQPLHWNIYARPPVDWATSATAGKPLSMCPVKPFYCWQHYDVWLTWGIVGIHAFGGLLVAIVVRYADNILKGFATGIAVIVSGLMSAAIWGYKPTAEFVVGAVLVTASTVMFHRFEVRK